MDGEGFLRERLRFAVRIGGAVLGFGVAGALLSALGAPDTAAWASAVAAAIAGWSGGAALMRRYEHRR
ncbi:hypothetical protein [Streptomyces meridianus]|uniref:Uncharacterized protein n=1 Tax=Streptomyces meridianus TaxID=2938945 RepID=A0ABT0X941_9ACTN|nr:hypothetical protein [Streptomyces meridianus]MCM2579046.1 hypothetical protein [Streptomyces meridianus]